MRLTVGSLFSGIGGLEKGLEMAGLGPVVWQCELDDFCRRVLAKHWPNVTRFSDVTSVRDYPYVDVICGGFPCQNLSSAGKMQGLSGSRSGLWYHYARIIQKVRPRFVVVENVASGARLWLPTVRRQLHLLGYDSTAYRISAADVGAPHLRRRIFVVASKAGTSANAHRDSEHAVPVDAEVARAPASESVTHWSQPEPDMVRVVHGVPSGVDGARRQALGNSAIPQCAEVVGRIVMQMARAA